MGIKLFLSEDPGEVAKFLQDHRDPEGYRSGLLRG